LNPVYIGAFPSGEAESIRTLQQAVILSAEVGVTERFALTGSLPLRSVELSGEDLQATGAGDLQIGVRQALTDPEKKSRFSAVATYGAWLPTGASNGRDDIAENISFSRGVVTAVAGGEFSLRIGPHSQIFGQFDMQFPTGADDVEGPGGSAARYRFAPSRTGSLLFSQSLPGEKVSWVGGLSQRYFGVDKMNGLPVETRGGAVRRIVGGFIFNVARRQTIGLLAERLAHANVNGDDITREGQLLATTEFVVAWQATFGTHRHPD